MGKKVYHPEHGFLRFNSSPEIKAILDKGGEVVECGMNEFKRILAERQANNGGIGGTGVSNAELSAQEALIQELNKRLNEREQVILELMGKIEALEKPKKSKKAEPELSDLVG